jgi:hypothetical protein
MSNGTLALAHAERVSSLAVVQDTMEALKAIRTYVQNEFVSGLDFGVIPGTGTKSTLLLPGAQKAFMYFHVFPSRDVSRQELGAGHLEVLVTTHLKSQGSGQTVGEGSGSCTSMEKKYRYRKADRTCPKCGASTIKQSKFGDAEFYCFSKIGGCGAKFSPTDRSILDQPFGQVDNPDIHDVRNTILKMAIKRADVSAAMSLACLSELFTQDLEDTYDLGAAPAEAAPPAPAKPAPEPPPAKPATNGNASPRCAKCTRLAIYPTQTSAGPVCYECHQQKCDVCNRVGGGRVTRNDGIAICGDCSKRHEDDARRAAFVAAPAPAPAPPPPTAPKPAPASTGPPPPDRVPASGRGLWRWAAEIEQRRGAGLIHYLEDFGRGLGWPPKIIAWTPAQVDDAYAQAREALELIYHPDRDESGDYDDDDARAVRWDDAREH